MGTDKFKKKKKWFKFIADKKRKKKKLQKNPENKSSFLQSFIIGILCAIFGLNTASFVVRIVHNNNFYLFSICALLYAIVFEITVFDKIHNFLFKRNV